jgi:hypothetical protein
MEHSKLPIWCWYIGIFLVLTESKSLSIKELQKVLGHKRYEPIWLMVSKIRIKVRTFFAGENEYANDPAAAIENFFSVSNPNG